MRALCALLLLLLAGQATAGVRDSRGKEVSLATPATRVVSLAPFLTELFYTIGADATLVGVSAFSDFPAPARSLPQVGGAGRIDIERLLALRPDLVVGWRSGNSAADIERVEKSGIKVYLAEPRKLDDIAPLMRDLGILTGHVVPADFAAFRFDGELAELRKRFVGRSPVRAFVQISAQPLMTLSGDHMMTDILALCGAVNVFADLPVLAGQVSVEDVLARDPDVVLIAETNPDARRAWQDLTQLRAAQTGHIHMLSPDLVLRPTARILTGARHVCRHVGNARKR